MYDIRSDSFHLYAFPYCQCILLGDAFLFEHSMLPFLCPVFKVSHSHLAVIDLAKPVLCFHSTHDYSHPSALTTIYLPF